MIRYSRQARLFAVSLSALAGFVDAVGFLRTGGLFVSFMSGNSTRLGIGTAALQPIALSALALIGMFVLGVMIGTYLGRRAGRHRAPAILLLIAALLALAATLDRSLPGMLTVALLAIAMGSENAVFEVDGEVRIGLTYMTGALVKIGQRLTGVLTGRGPTDWQPYLLLWLGLAAGSCLGATLYPRLGFDALWLASAAAALLSLAAGAVAAED